MMRDRTMRILAEGVRASNDTWETGLNNNSLIIGPSGAGKTRGFVIPNILASEGSLVVTDTKGDLYGKLAPQLKRKGFAVECLDFVDVTKSKIGYDPLDYVRMVRDVPREQDMLSIAAALCTVENSQDPFWDYAARGIVASMIGYVMAALPAEERHLSVVAGMYDLLIDGRYARLVSELEPGSFAVQQLAPAIGAKDSEKMLGSLNGVVGEKLAPYRVSELCRLFDRPRRVRFENLRRRRTALFVHISDVDGSMDKLIALFYSQLFKALIGAKEKPGKPFLPVHVIMDDFACGCRVHGFDRIISVIRSRDIYASIIIQSISQLQGLYGAQASAIAESCDSTLYLGGNDPGTARWIAERANRPPHAVLSMPVGEALLLQRGKSARSVRVYKPEDDLRKTCRDRRDPARELPDPWEDRQSECG